jgi:uncharacterized caspase-like protein
MDLLPEVAKMRCSEFSLSRLAAVCLVVSLASVQTVHAGNVSEFPFDWRVPPPHVYVLAIGVDHYPSKGWTDLAGAVNDAEMLGAIFRSSELSGFHAQVEVLTNEKATKEAIRATLQKWAQSANPEDLFIFSFSGHAATVGGKGQESYLAPADAAAGCETRFCADDRTLISGSLLYSWMTQIRSRRQVLLLDASFSDRKFQVFESYWRREACNVGPDAMKRILLLTNHGGGDEQIGPGKITGMLSFAAANALRGTTQGGSGSAQSAGLEIPLITAAGIQQSIYRHFISLGMKGEVRAELLGGDFVVSGPSGRVASPEELLLDSGLGPVCYEDATSPSRGVSAVAANASESSATTSAAPKNYALLVASDNYKNWPRLSNPIFDAGTIEADLKKAYGFEVEHLFDPSRQELKTKLEELHQRQFGPDDQLFIFVAGHGDYDATNDIGYLVFKDSPAGHDYDSDMNLMELRSRIDTIPAKHILLVMDSCFAGSLDPELGGVRGRGEYDPIPLETLVERSAAKKTRMFLTSGNKEYVPDGQPGHHSPFAALFINALEKKGSPDGYLSLAKLPQYFQRLSTAAHMGSLGHNQEGSEFFFIPQ